MRSRRTDSAATSIGSTSGAAFADQGPSQKRVRPAPMGRAFRVLKRTAHLTVQVAERPEAVVPVGTSDAPATRRPRAGAKKKAG